MVTVTFQRPDYDSTTSQIKDKKDPSTTQVRPKYDPSTTQVQELIIHMSDQFMSIKSMIAACGLKSRKRFRENYVTPALLDNAIERKYPNEPNHPRQMYRLTKHALEWKKSQED